MFIVYYCLRNIQGPHYFPNRGYENLRKINTFSQFRQIFFTLKRDFDTALSFKKNVISQKIVLFYSANFGGFSSLVYLLSQSHCVYKSKSQKPLNISFTPK